MGYFKSDIRRLSKSYAWYIGIIGVAFALFFSLEGRGFENGSVVFTYVFATNLSGILIAYVFGAVPFATVFSEDLEHKYIRYEVIRGNLKKYVLSKCTVIYLSSIITMICGTLIFLLFCRLQIPWVNWEMTDLSLERAGCYGSLVERGHYLSYCMLYALHMGMLSSVLSLMAAFGSIYISNRVLVLVLPVLLCRILGTVYINGYNIYVFYAYVKIFEQDWINFLFIFGLSVILSGVMVIGIYKKLKQGI